jgi:hypothetical protein
VTADPHPRYVIREITGHPAGVGSRAVSTSLWIADTWICWREIKHWYSEGRGSGRTYAMARAEAEQLCDEWNAEHDAWLAEDVA